MKIDSYAVEARSTRSYISITSATITHKAVQAKPQQALKEAEENAAEVNLSDQIQDYIEDTKEQQKRNADQAKALAKPIQKSHKYMPMNPSELKIYALELLLSHLTGKKVKLQQADRTREENNAPEKMTGFGGAAGQAATATKIDRMETELFHYESEIVDYAAQGIIKTADGKTITVDINMHMSREFTEYAKYTSEQAISPCDPLVINYGGTAASLSQETFDFDLNFDGKMDNIHFAGDGSGFLALDKNGDGKINDGQELFGPSSGAGFSELRAYDEDGNNWIDENDEVFHKLLVWSKDKDGRDQLFRLSELDIGAIYLGDVETQFSMQDENNKTMGVMRSTSFYLKEHGGAGFISHIDLSL